MPIDSDISISSGVTSSGITLGDFEYLEVLSGGVASQTMALGQGAETNRVGRTGRLQHLRSEADRVPRHGRANRVAGLIGGSELHIHRARRMLRRDLHIAEVEARQIEQSKRGAPMLVVAAVAVVALFASDLRELLNRPSR